MARAGGARVRLDGIVAISTGAQATRFEIGRAADGVMSRLADMLQNPGRSMPLVAMVRAVAPVS
jgi:hypothetical protein